MKRMIFLAILLVGGASIGLAVKREPPNEACVRSSPFRVKRHSSVSLTGTEAINQPWSTVFLQTNALGRG